MSESIPLEGIEIGKKISSCRYYKMKELMSHKTNFINEVIEDKIEETAIIFSDKANLYPLFE